MEAVDITALRRNSANICSQRDNSIFCLTLMRLQAPGRLHLHFMEKPVTVNLDKPTRKLSFKTRNEF